MSENPNTWSSAQRIAAGLPASGPLINITYYTFVHSPKSEAYLEAEREHWKLFRERGDAVEALFEIEAALEKSMNISEKEKEKNPTFCAAKLRYENAREAEQQAYNKKMFLAPPPPERITIEEWVSPSYGHPFTCVSCKDIYNFELNYKGDGYKCKSCC